MSDFPLTEVVNGFSDQHLLLVGKSRFLRCFQKLHNSGQEYVWKALLDRLDEVNSRMESSQEVLLEGTVFVQAEIASRQSWRLTLTDERSMQELMACSLEYFDFDVLILLFGELHDHYYRQRDEYDYGGNGDFFWLDKLVFTRLAKRVKQEHKSEESVTGSFKDCAY